MLTHQEYRKTRIHLIEAALQICEHCRMGFTLNPKEALEKDSKRLCYPWDHRCWSMPGGEGTKCKEISLAIQELDKQWAETKAKMAEAASGLVDHFMTQFRQQATGPTSILRAQEMVKEFHEKYGLSVNKVPTMPDKGVLLLRLDLMLEELAEFSKGARCGNIVGCADALGDIVYTALGAAVTMGINLSPILQEIHNSNMTKDKSYEGGKVCKGTGYVKPDIPRCLKEQLKGY